MDHHSRLSIYKGMIQYILDSTNYTLKNIAELSNSPLNNIRSIYCHDLLPNSFQSEFQLLKLYQIVLEINTGKKHQTCVG